MSVSGELRLDTATVVQRLRIRAMGGERESTESRVRAIVSAADLAPPTMPARAILIVKRFGRDLPPLTVSPHRVLPPADWQRAVSDGMSEVGSRAARPARGAVQASADAVWFDDRAEMLACLALDWLNGVAGARWWWQAFFRNVDLRLSVPDVWTESPEYVPTALEQLATRHASVRFVQMLGAERASQLLLAVARAFSLRALELAIRSFEGQSVAMRAAHAQLDDKRKSVARSAAQVESAPAPWVKWVRDADAPEVLEPEARILLAVCLMLRRAPEVVRKASFASRLAVWLSGLTPMPPAIRSPSPAMPARLPDQAAAPPLNRPPVAEPELPAALTRVPEQKPSPDVPAPAPGVSAAIQPPTTEPEAIGAPAMAPPHSRESPPAIPVVEASQVEAPPAIPDVEALQAELPVLDEAPNAAEPSAAVESEPATVASAVEVETAFGGVFYLINLGLFLEFYGDFTTPDEPGIDLPIWDFLALVGRDLAGDAIQEDAIWGLLADLANRRRDEEPGAGYEDWFREQMPKMRARLTLALGLDGEGRLGELLLRHDATAMITPTHLDVFFSLQDHPIEIRLSGLDRTPGWTPAAGRYIAFHFE